MSDHPDVLIKQTTIIDGTGAPARRGNIAIKNGRITAVGDTEVVAEKVIDGSDLITCPGFIDPHSHADSSILKSPTANSKIMEGITTSIGGNCGISMAPVDNQVDVDYVTRFFAQDVSWRTFAEYLDRVEEVQPAVNVVPLVGHNPIRASVMGEDFKRNATDDEIQFMKQHVKEAMDAGALGFTTGLDSSFGEYADVDEIAALAAVAGELGGLYASHVQHNQSQWPADNLEEFAYGVFHGPIEDVWVGRYHGYKEAVEVGRRANLPDHISHLATAFAIPQPHPDFLSAAAAKATVVQFVDKPRAKGIQVTFDTIFAPASIASPAKLLTAFRCALSELGENMLVEKLKTADFRQELRQTFDNGKVKMGMLHPKADPFWADCFQVVTHKNKACEGKLVSEILAASDGHPVEVLADVILEDPEAVWVQIKDKKRTPPALTAFLEHPLCMSCTDTFAHPEEPNPDDYRPPAVAYGMCPSYIDSYVKKQHALSLEDAIQRATQLPAQTFKIKDRGVLKPGAFADLGVFDLEQVKMMGNALEPERPPAGIEYVLVNGQTLPGQEAHRSQTGKGLAQGVSNRW